MTYETTCSILNKNGVTMGNLQDDFNLTTNFIVKIIKSSAKNYIYATSWVPTIYTCF